MLEQTNVNISALIIFYDKNSSSFHQKGKGLRTFLAFIVTFATAGASVAQANEAHLYQSDIDSAYKLIFDTHLGKAICRQILGAEPNALYFHLGVSLETAKEIVESCPRGVRHRLIYPTKPEHIRKLSLKPAQARKFKILVSQISFPIESWTEPFTNTTVVVTPSLPINQDRWVQILAHEMAVYFDSKVNPAHPDASEIPELEELNVKYLGRLNPLMAVSNPLHGHALTFLRALQVEGEILSDLLKEGKVQPGEPLFSSYQNSLIDPKCGHDCIRDLMFELRRTLMPISLPLLAFAPYYRSLILAELPRLKLEWPESTWQRARLVLNNMPLNFLNKEFGGDPVEDMKKVFYANLTAHERFKEIVQFLDEDLWPLEKQALFSATLAGHQETFIEYMKKPLLSGYNIGLSSGPRVRIRTGDWE